MSVIGSLALSVVARTERIKQDLKPALDAIKDWGVAAEKAGLSTSEVNREMARMRADAVRGPKAAAEATDNLRQKLQNAKQGAAALTGAISAMSSEVGGTVGHVTRLGTSLTSAFLAGGPIALGVTALAAGISAITGASNEAAKAAEEARKAHLRWMEDANRETESVLKSVTRLRHEIRAAELGDPSLAAAFANDEESAAAYKVRLDGIAESERKIREARAGQAGLLALPGGGDPLRRQDLGDGDLGRRFDALEAEAKAEQEKIDAYNKVLRALDEETKLRAKLAEYEKPSVKAAQDTAEAHAKSAASIKDVLAGARSWNELGSDIAKDAERINKAMNAELAQQINSAYGRMAKDHADALAAAEGQAKAAEEIAKASESAASSAKEMATAAEVRAESEKIVTEQVREQSRLVAKRLDITKRFSNVGGSMFGFGAGQVGTGLGDIGGDAARARRAAGDIPGRGGGAAAALAAGVAKLPEASADIKAAEAAIAKIPPLFERLTGATTSFAATTKSVVGDLGRSTDRAVGSLRSTQEAMAAEVRALSKAIERAGNGTGVGD